MVGLNRCINLLCGGSLFLFFFQAEDGIRDRNVTGVQTCALPISSVPRAGEEEDVEIVAADDAVQMRVEEVQPRRRAPVPEEARLHVLRTERLPEERVEIGRASCRERGESWVGARAHKKNV